MVPIIPAKGPRTPSYSQLSTSGLLGIIGIKHLRQGDFLLEKLKVYTCPSNLLIAPDIKIFFFQSNNH